MSRLVLLIVCWGVSEGVLAQDHPAPNPSNDNATQQQPAEAKKEAASAKPAAAGIDRPAAFVPGFEDEAEVRVLLRDVKEEPQQADLEVGPLTGSEYPALQMQPTLTLVSNRQVEGDREVQLKIQGIVPFGESTVPLFYKGKQKEVLRFSKSGLIVAPPPEGGYVARQGEQFLLVLENPSAIEYPHVRARLRFEDTDICSFAAERFPGFAPQEGNKPDCSRFDNWTDFRVPQYAQISLRSDPADTWFNDPQTNYARSGKRKGWLTLRFVTAHDVIHEQTVPMEIDFEPGWWNTFSSLAWVFWWLLLGALLSLALRVWIPNFRKKRQLKDRSIEARKQTRAISGEVDSMLRVLLRVERVALDQLRRSESAVWPIFADLAQRVDQRLALLQRRISAVQRLDTALRRKRLLLEQGVAPTRLQQIETELTNASEALKGEQLADSDWVFIQQRLEAAEKLLREPTKDEKDAFDALLVERWKNISAHFRREDSGALSVPDALASNGMDKCFPPASALPDVTVTPHEDGSQWVKSIGAVRADLQLTALELLRDFEFVARAKPEPKWDYAREALKPLLTTPTVENLQEARSWLRQMAEGIAEADITADLIKGAFSIEKDPQMAGSDEKVRWQVRMHRAELNTATAREDITCEWQFLDTMVSKRVWVPRSPSETRPPARELSTGGEASEAKRPDPNPPQREQLEAEQSEAKELKAKQPDANQSDTCALVERGWEVWHYFEPQVTRASIYVSFFDSKGEPMKLTSPNSYKRDVTIQDRERRIQERKDRRSRQGLEAVQLLATLLVPLATLAMTTQKGASSLPWDLVAIGFGSDTIKNILVGRQDQAQTGGASS